MSRAADATPGEIAEAFETALRDGPPMVSDTGLDPRTWEAIALVWAAGPNPPEGLIAAARAELHAQLDGTHAALDAAEADRSANESARRHGIIQ
ncbi:MAG: hypothetical protein ACLP3C_08415 [Mycobacterium sp.]|uniref:hypothetical protein n=1 Tax=Mycobacterium sp. TaxID=1785 RepID=UPI003F9493ED